MNALTREEEEYISEIIFCNASTIGTTAILLNSRSEAFPDGMGNGSGELKHNMMDHDYGMGAWGRMPGFEDVYYDGRKPLGFLIPRFRNIDEATKRPDYLRGYGYQGLASRGHNVVDRVIGVGLKQKICETGPYNISMT